MTADLPAAQRTDPIAFFNWDSGALEARVIDGAPGRTQPACRLCVIVIEQLWLLSVDTLDTPDEILG
jgi:hypothetical protein